MGAFELESLELGLLRNASGFSPELGKVEEEFERVRYEMQESRLRLLFDSGQARKQLSFDDSSAADSRPRSDGRAGGGRELAPSAAPRRRR